MAKIGRSDCCAKKRQPSVPVGGCLLRATLGLKALFTTATAVFCVGIWASNVAHAKPLMVNEAETGEASSAGEATTTEVNNPLPALAELSSISTNNARNLRELARTNGNGGALVYYPTLTLNGVSTRLTIPTRVNNGALIIEVAALRNAGVKVPSFAAEWEDISALSINGSFNSNEQTLALTVPTQWLQPQFFSMHNRQPTRTQLSKGSGFLLNYDVYALRNTEQQNFLSVNHEGRYFFDNAVFRSSAISRFDSSSQSQHGSSSAFTRLDTAIEFTDRDAMRTIVIGDSVTGGLNWMPALRFAGFQIQRNFSTQPDVITFPIPQISGSAVLPSVVDVFVNELKVGEQSVAPGPYVIDTLPTLSGLGEVQLVTTDIMGRQTVNSMAFYVSPSLLREGLSDFSFNTGVTRESYGLYSDSYAKNVFTSGAFRYGLNNSLTVEAGFSAADKLINSGIGATFTAGLLGLTNVSLSYGSNSAFGGLKLAANHEYRNQRLGLGIRFTEQSAQYQDLATWVNREATSKRTAQLNASLFLGNSRGTISASYLNITPFQGDPTEYMVFNYNRSYWQRLSTNFSFNQNLRNRRDQRIQLNVSMPLGNGRNRIQTGLNSRYRRDEGNRTVVSARKGTSEYWDIGWHVASTVSDNSYQTARMNWYTPYGQVDAGIFGSNGEHNTFLNATGSIVAGSGYVFPANRVSNSFAIVDTGEFNNVPVFLANRKIGYTNRNGKLMLNHLTPYIENKITIDPLLLPHDVHVKASEQYIMPGANTGVVVPFTITQQHSAITSIYNSEGSLPPGGTVVLNNNYRSRVGFNGELYLQQIQQGTNIITVMYPNYHCRGIFEFNPSPGEISRLAPIACEAVDEEYSQ